VTVQRIASVIGVPAAGIAEYERLHRSVWPGVLETLSRHHMRNYSIYRFGELLFSYLEYDGDDLAADEAAIAADPVTREWWAECMPLQRPVEGAATGEWWMPLPELFHHD
jgi:L-rhamnose mutarotase